MYFTPWLYRGVRAELLVRTPTGIAYLGHLYAGESGQFRPLIFFGSGAVFRQTDTIYSSLAIVNHNYCDRFNTVTHHQNNDKNQCLISSSS